MRLCVCLCAECCVLGDSPPPFSWSHGRRDVRGGTYCPTKETMRPDPTSYNIQARKPSPDFYNAILCFILLFYFIFFNFFSPSSRFSSSFNIILLSNSNPPGGDRLPL